MMLMFDLESFVFLIVVVFDCWTVRLPKVRLRSIGKIFL